MEIQEFNMTLEVNLKAEVHEDGVVPLEMRMSGQGDGTRFTQLSCLVAAALIRKAGEDMGLEAALEEFNHQVMSTDMQTR